MYKMIDENDNESTHTTLDGSDGVLNTLEVLADSTGSGFSLPRYREDSFRRWQSFEDMLVQMTSEESCGVGAWQLECETDGDIVMAYIEYTGE
jgi:hypothetical protein